MLDPFAPGNFAENRVLKPVEPFSGLKRENLPQNPTKVMYFAALTSFPEAAMTAAILLFNSLAREFYTCAESKILGLKVTQQS